MHQAVTATPFFSGKLLQALHQSIFQSGLALLQTGQVTHRGAAHFQQVAGTALAQSLLTGEEDKAAFLASA